MYSVLSFHDVASVTLMLWICRCVFAWDGEAVLSQSLLMQDLAMNIQQNKIWGTYRHMTLPQLVSKPSQHALLNVATRGDLASLTWFQMAEPEASDPGGRDSLLCEVYYAPLNFRDVMLATGKLPPDALPGDLATKVCWGQVVVPLHHSYFPS